MFSSLVVFLDNKMGPVRVEVGSCFRFGLTHPIVLTWSVGDWVESTVT